MSRVETEVERAEQAALEAGHGLVLAEQKAADAAKADELIRAQVAETERELAEFSTRVRAVNPDDPKAVGRLASERAALELRREALAAKAERAERARQEAEEALVAARTKLEEAESARARAQVQAAEDHLAGHLDKLLADFSAAAAPHLALVGYSDGCAYILARLPARRAEEQERERAAAEALRLAALTPAEQERARARERLAHDPWLLPEQVMELHEKINVSRVADDSRPMLGEDGSRVVDGVRVVRLDSEEMRAYRDAARIERENEEMSRD